MGESISKLIAMLLACVLLFIVPTIHSFEQQDEVTRIYVLNKTMQFVDGVRNTGTLTRDMYEDFLLSLSATNVTYDVKMEHYNKQIIPVYANPGVPSSFTGTYDTHYQLFIHDEILRDLYSGGSYTYKEGDFFNIHVLNGEKTIATRLRELLTLSNLPKEKIMVAYGGMIKNETH